MIYPTVNLLKKSEQRFQGPVSQRFMVISAIATPILLIALLATIRLFQFNGLKSDLETQQLLKSELQPRVVQFGKKKQQLKQNKQTIELLKSWEESRVPIVDLMNEIQGAVPENIQFLRLYMGGQIVYSTYETPKEIGLNFLLQIDGIAEGDEAIPEIWKLQDNLLALKTLTSRFPSIKIAGSPQPQHNQGSIPVLKFSIHGSEAEGKTP